METYLNQLVADIKAATLARWQQRPPSLYHPDLTDPLFQPPEGYVAQEPEEMPIDIEAMLEESEIILEDQSSEPNMFDHFGYVPEQFPPADLLTEAQARELVDALARLMVVWNFIPTIPKKLPSRMFYSLLLEKMKEPAYVFLQGAIGIDFCWFIQDECPFGAEYCDCRDSKS